MIELKDVSYVYHLSDTDGNRIINPVISHLSMTIPGGEFVVLTGSSGCGKTTLCRMINGLVPHYFEGELKGKILVDGEEVSSQPIYQTAKKVGSVFQNPRSQFFNVDTTSELAFTAENQGRNPESILHDIKDVTKKLNIETLLDRSMFQLSGGEKQKIACGSVAVADQPVIVLDEPTSNLDMEAIKDLEIILEKWKKAGKTIVIAEHRLFFLRNLADRVFVLEDGALKHELTGKQFRELQIEEMEDMGLRTDSLSKVMLKNTAQKSDTYIKIHNVKFTYSDKIHGIDIPEANIPANRVIGIIGHNGAGKSTFAKTLCDLNRKAKGNVTIKDETILAKKMSEHCYMIAQDVNHMLFTESVLDEILLSIPDDISAKEQIEKATNTLRHLDMEEGKELHPMSLSGGQKQRVAIASGLVSNKNILFLDEPTSGLDYAHMVQTANVLKHAKEQGKTVFVITHDLELLSLSADYILHIENGKIKDCYLLDDEGYIKLRNFFIQ